MINDHPAITKSLVRQRRATVKSASLWEDPLVPHQIAMKRSSGMLLILKESLKVNELFDDRRFEWAEPGAKEHVGLSGGGQDVAASIRISDTHLPDGLLNLNQT